MKKKNYEPSKKMLIMFMPFFISIVYALHIHLISLYSQDFLAFIPIKLQHK